MQIVNLGKVMKVECEEKDPKNVQNSGPTMKDQALEKNSDEVEARDFKLLRLWLDERPHGRV
jgi:hypothetical protein